MNEKKNIDRLFQEKFKDFEVTPPDFVWQNLEAELQEKKKKRRILPLWFRLSGVAAILVIGFFAAMPFITNDSSNANPVVLETKEINPDGSPRINPTDNPVRQSQSVETVIASGETIEKQTTGEEIKASPVTPQAVNDGVAYSQTNKGTTSTKPGRNKVEKPDRNAIATQKDAVAQNSSNANRKNNAVQNNSPAVNNPERHNTNVQKNIAPNSITEEGVAETDNKPDNKEDNTAGQGNDITKPEGIAISRELNISEAVANTDIAIDTATTILSENELEEMYRKKLQGKEDEEKAVAEAGNRNKWNIKPQMAPLFFNTASEGSPIDADLATNSKNFDNDLSYGVGINYALTDKITIRSGINTVNMKYATNNVEYYATLNSPANEGFTNTNVSPAGPGASLVIGTPQPTSSAAGTQLNTQSFEGSVVQKMGFVEVPVEMSYKLINRRFGVDLIGGVSTLFLNDNNVSIISEQGFRSDMGEARNLNNVSFSTNVGIGFKYRIFDSFEANFEPMFKYQINTFSSDAGNFKPYFIGLYSGVSFSF